MNRILLNDFGRIKPFVLDVELLRGTRWLITGANGMICSYLLAFLCWLNETELDCSLTVTAIVRRKPDPLDTNIGYLLGKEYVSFRTADLGEEWELEAGDHFDYIFHGATSAAPRAYLADPLSTINVNVKTTQKLLDYARRDSRLKSLIYVSSGEIYGNPDSLDVPTPESYIGTTDHLSTRSCYVESKRFTETLCMNYFRQYQVPVRIIRPVQLYGPGFKQDDSRAWAEFVVKRFRGEPIDIMGDGTARRGYCYLADAVTQILAVLQCGESGGVYNIGSEDHISIRELAETVANLDSPVIPVVIKNDLPSYLQASPQVSCPSIARVSGLAPLLNTPLRQGLSNCLEWLKSLSTWRQFESL